MRDPMQDLEPRIRRDIEDLAASHQVSAEALITEFVSAYIRLLRDVPPLTTRAWRPSARRTSRSAPSPPRLPSASAPP